MLETKSFLYHDLLHFAVEMEAKIGFGFYGLLAQGEWNREHAESEPEKTAKTMEVEQVVGALTGWFKEPRENDDEVVQRLGELRESQRLSPITWVTVETIEGVRRRMRALLGEWNHTEFHTPMKLTFECA